MEKKEKDRIDDTLASKRKEPALSPNEQAVDVSVPSVSGDFIGLDQSGRLAALSRLILKYEAVASELAKVQEKLKHCNDPLSLADFERHCQKAKKSFAEELKKLVRTAEAKKSNLQNELQTLETQIRNEGVVVEAPKAASQLYQLREREAHSRATDPSVAARNAVIDRCWDKKTIDICRQLDLEFPAVDGNPPEQLPESWFHNLEVTSFSAAYMNAKCRPLVEKLISERRRRNRLRP